MVSALKVFFNWVSSTTTRTGWERTCPAAARSFCDGPQQFLPLFTHMCLAHAWLLLVLSAVCWGRAQPLAPNQGLSRRRVGGWEGVFPCTIRVS